MTTTESNELLVGVVVGGGTLTVGAGLEMLAPTPGAYDVTAGLTSGNTWLVTATAFR